MMYENSVRFSTHPTSPPTSRKATRGRKALRSQRDAKLWLMKHEEYS